MKKPSEEDPQGKDRRSEPRTVLSDYQYSSVEFSIDGLAPAAYIFKVRDISPSGLGILVNKESAILGHIKVGDILTLTYNPVDSSKPLVHLRTEIRHITENDERFRGQVLVGLLILKE